MSKSLSHNVDAARKILDILTEETSGNALHVCTVLCAINEIVLSQLPLGVAEGILFGITERLRDRAATVTTLAEAPVAGVA